MSEPKYLTDPAQGISAPEISQDYAGAILEGLDDNDLLQADLAAVVEQEAFPSIAAAPTLRITCYRAETYTVDVETWVRANRPEWLEDDGDE